MALVPRGRRALAAASALVLAGAGVAAPATAAPRVATDLRSYTAAVNLLDPDAPGSSGFQGGVSFTTLDGRTTVNVFLSRGETVVCADGSEDIRSTTLRTESDEAASPGPVALEIDRRLRTAVGEAVVGIVEEVFPGCGVEPTTTMHPAERVAITVAGTSVRFRTGIGSRASSGPDAASFSSVDFSRDGTGTATVGAWVTGAASDAAFLRYAVDRTSSHGSVIDVPPNAAPAGGLGALGAYSHASVVDGLEVFEDVFVTAAIGPEPDRAETVYAYALRSTLVPCDSGGYAERLDVVEGFGPADVAIEQRLARADAAAVLDAWHLSADGCTGESSEGTATVPVLLALEAVGDAVRSVDTRFQVTPGEGVERTRLTYRARPAAGSVAVGDVSGTPDLAAISRAGR